MRREFACTVRCLAAAVFVLAGMQSVWGQEGKDEPAGPGPGGVFPKLSLADHEPPDQAPNPPPRGPWRTFEFTAGADFSSINSAITLDHGGSAGSIGVEPEQQLGMNDAIVAPAVWTALRIGDIHRIQFSFDQFTRSSTTTLDDDTAFNGNLYPAGIGIHSTLGVQFYDLAYVWSFYQDDRVDLGVSFGVDLVRTHFSIEGSASRLSDHARQNIPFPVVGFNFDLALSPSWWIRERLEAMYLADSSYEMLVVDLNLGIEWTFTDHLAVGLQGKVQRLQMEQNSTNAWGNWQGEFQMSTSGILLYLNVYF